MRYIRTPPVLRGNWDQGISTPCRGYSQRTLSPTNWVWLQYPINELKWINAPTHQKRLSQPDN